MNIRKTFYIILLLFLSNVITFAQNSSSPEMASVMRSNGKIYVVVGTLVLIFLGIVFYLFSIERKVKNIENTL